MSFSKVSFREHGDTKGYKCLRIFLLSFQYIPNEVSIKPSAKEDDKGNPCFVIDKLVKRVKNDHRSEMSNLSNWKEEA